ncbi:class I SAM-dependent methyltransferase [Sphingomonas sp. LY29]|uniref:class I SAM-dependent methyltransferase n=1 Tax=Sphingomonas sp. LY29 TaxID=3095341 RepID=UPI002D769C97|nr:class I SAM-dependent methyltransferase [Sphingomonas sp. LY29]WRP26358.1 class I SAM-dependent methyltransferase [Sphingomonas sp. LY29]
MLEGLIFGRSIAARRAVLRSHFDVRRQFEEIEESCIPSYVHANRLAAWVAWQRNKKAGELYRRYAPVGPILDFGAATGEVGHLIPKRGPYLIIEQDEALARACEQWQQATRTSLEKAQAGSFAAIFALDSLEHNEDIPAIVAKLVPLLRSDGVLILSGPTESALYRLGRKIAGFSGHYHHSTIYDIERIVSGHLSLVKARKVPFAPALFRVTVWRRP